MTQAELSKALAVLLAKGTVTKKGNGKGKGRKARRVKSDDATLNANAEANAKATEALFRSKGFEDCRANVTILTYKKWLAKGRKVKENEKALHPMIGNPPRKGYALFHISQTEPVDVKSVAISAEDANENVAN